MRLKITHTTRYDYGKPVPYGLQQLRLTPQSSATQSIINWSVSLDGGQREAQFTDQHGNVVDLVSVEPDADAISITSVGEVETIDQAGIVGPHDSATPLWYFKRDTEFTRPGPRLAALVADFDSGNVGDLDRLHALSRHVVSAVVYNTGSTHTTTTAEHAVKSGRGVCQDHAHVFLGAVRSLGYPARYVSGYLMMDDHDQQDASHAWVEVFVDDLGWVGFDISNGISPDERYVRLATGLDFKEAAPISGFVFGGGTESMIVSLQVQQ